MPSKTTMIFFRVSDPVTEELVRKLRQSPDRAEQRVIAKKVVDREHDQVLRMWMAYDGGFLVFRPHLGNVGAGVLGRTDGYGASAIARSWIHKQPRGPRKIPRLTRPAASGGGPQNYVLIAPTRHPKEL